MADATNYKYGDPIQFEDWDPNTGRVFITRGTFLGHTAAGTHQINTATGVRFIAAGRIVGNLYRVRAVGDIDARIVARDGLERDILATTAAVAAKRYLDVIGTRHTANGDYRAPLRLKAGENITLRIERLR